MLLLMGRGSLKYFYSKKKKKEYESVSFYALVPLDQCQKVKGTIQQSETDKT